MLPWTPMSRPDCDLSSATTSAIGPETATELFQVLLSGLDVTTTLRTPLMKSANGCSFEVGQYPHHSSYMCRPSSTVSWVAMTRRSFSIIASSNVGAALSWLPTKYAPGSSTSPSSDISV